MTQSRPETDTLRKRGMPVWVQVIVWLVLFGLLALVAFGLRRSQQGTVQVGEQIPDFKLTLFNGYDYNSETELHLGQMQGKVIVMNFWASWCKPCEQEAAELEEAWKNYENSGDVVFVGVDYVDTEPEAISYLKKFGITFPNGPDMGTKISQSFRIKGVPETYIVDKSGKIAYIQVGPFVSVDEIISVIESVRSK
jgi:cytochrome c biogenesis protein CcmG/thiol:disulfide interchange protein DsbE